MEWRHGISNHFAKPSNSGMAWLSPRRKIGVLLMPVAQSTPTATRVKIDFPPLPKIVVDPKTWTVNQDALDQWYFNLRTVVIREFEALAVEIDKKQNA